MSRQAQSRTLILASASPRRRRILRELGARFRVFVPRVPETHLLRAPRRTVLENARRKGMACRRRFPSAWIIAADTVVAFRGRCVNKPASRAEAAQFLLSFSDRPQFVYTAVFLGAPGRRPAVRVVRSTVRFKRLTPALVARYFRYVNPMDKAGAYDIDQRGKWIIAGFTGSYTNIVGLPQEPVAAWLKQEGLVG